MGQRYREMDIVSATPEMLVVKLYDGALRFARLAREHLEAGRPGEKGQALARALAIVSELRHALDFERGGEIARNLESLYGFVADRLVSAHFAPDPAPIEDALAILERLRGAWAEIAAGGGDRAVDAA